MNDGMTVKTQWWAWIVYLWIVASVGCLVVWATLPEGGQGSRGDWLGMGLPGLILGPIFALAARSGRADQRIAVRVRREGIDGVARIISCQERGGSHNYKPRFGVEIEITVQGKPPYTSTKNLALHAHVAAKLEPESTWPVRIDPTDDHRFSIEGFEDY